MSQSNKSFEKNKGKKFTQEQQFEIDKIFNGGVKLHQLGNLDEARIVYQEVLRRQPNHFGSLHLLGVVALQSGNYELAVNLIKSAIKIKNNDESAHSNIGIAFFNLKKLNEALLSQTNAISLKPNFPQAYYNRAIVFHELKKFEKAIQDYDKAISFKPDYIDAYFNRGNACLELMWYEEAIASYDGAIAIDASYAAAHCNKGNALLKLKKFNESIESYNNAIALNKEYYDAYYNRGDALIEIQHLDDAVSSYDEAIALKPGSARAFFNRGDALIKSGRLNESVDSFKKSILLEPDFSDAYLALGNALMELQDLDEAIINFDRAFELNPNLNGALLNKSFALLLLGDYENGWSLYESRAKIYSRPHQIDNLKIPKLARGDNLFNKVVLLYSEQGFGDTIQFCRYAKIIKSLGAKTLLLIPMQLRSLMEGVDGVDELFTDVGQLPPADFCCSLMSLPLICNTTLSTIPSMGKYLYANESKIEYWESKIREKNNFKVGLVWNGGFRANQPELWAVNARRNISLKIISDHLRNVDVDFYSLQKGDPAESEIKGREFEYWPEGNFINYMSEVDDFSDTAALIENLDLVISVDTSSAHLAAALGKPTWILNRFDTCWRWLLNREDSPWYPSVKLYRQGINRDWDSVLRRVSLDLSSLSK